MTFWNDFNDAGRQVGFDLIPKGTLLKIRMTIRQGGFDDPSGGWTGAGPPNPSTPAVCISPPNSWSSKGRTPSASCGR